jgi:hypothetical protein
MGQADSVVEKCLQQQELTNVLLWGHPPLPLAEFGKWLKKVILRRGRHKQQERRQCWSCKKDEAVVFEEFFIASLWMPAHPVLADILLKF